MVQISVVTGPPAGGKSTHVQQSKAAGDVVIDFDQIALCLGSEVSHDASEPIKQVTFAARDAAIAVVLAGVEADAWIIHSRPSAKQLAEYAAAGADVVTIDPGMEAALEQAQADERPAWTEQAIRLWYERQADPDPTEKADQPSIRKAAAMEPILLQKNFTAKAEATEGGEPGEFEAIVSAFGNEDSQGDIVENGAFAKSLTEWADRGRPIPVVWSHQFQDPDSFLGVYKTAEETDAGLKLKGVLDLDHPKAARVHKLMREGVIVEFSISGLVREYELLKDEDEDSWFPPMLIKDIDLWEAGPCFKGANANTELLSVKTITEAVSRGVVTRKEGRVLATKHVDALKDAYAKLGDIIAAVEKAEPEDAPGKEKTVQLVTPNVRALLELNTIH